MRAGQLRYRCKVFQLVTTKDSLGGIVKTYQPAGELWADINSVSGRTFLTASQEQSEITKEIYIRYRPDIVAGTRLQDGDFFYEVVAPLADRKRTSLKLMCKTVTPHEKF